MESIIVGAFVEEVHMLKSYLDYLDENPEKREKEIGQAEKELTFLKEMKRQEEKKKTEAFKKSDIDMYTSASDELKKLSTQISMTKSKLELISRIDPGAHAEAWEKYAAEYNAEFNERMKEYHKSRRKLAEEYLEVIRFISDGNKEYHRMCENLKDVRIDCRNITEILPHLSATGFKGSNSFGNIVSGDAIVTCEELQLRTGIKENICMIEHGFYADDIFSESLREVVANMGAEESKRSIAKNKAIAEEGERLKKESKRNGAMEIVKPKRKRSYRYADGLY